jgi:TolB-like protein/DNA-binding winged helix-turn-helix (wHTH) protein/Tfp pilus assembly protein PilF
MSAEHPQNTPIQIGDLRLDPRQRCVWRGDEKIQLPKLSFDLLLCLARHAPAVVSMDQLLTEVWGDVVVGDETVKQRVRMLRQSLSETGEQPKYLESVRSIGYRLIPSVSKADIPGAQAPRNRWLWPGIAAFAVMALAVFQMTDDQDQIVPGNEVRHWSVAVLPFEDMSPNADQAYFSDGMHEEIITRLSYIPALAVTSRTSVLPYRAADKSVAEIAAELGVNLIIEGSVRHSDEQIRITIQLIDAVSDEHLWAATYDRPLRIGDIFDIQSDVAEKVAAALQIELHAAAAGDTLPTDSLAAYNNYLLGRYHVHRGNSRDLERSIEFFEQAIAEAPDFAAAHVGLGQALTFVGTTYGWLPPGEVFTRAELEVSEALRLDPDSIDAYSLRGDILTWYRWNWAEAEDAYKMAIDNGAQFDLGYMLLLSALGRHDEAASMMEGAIEAFPRDRWVRSNAAWRFLGAGDYERAIAEADAAIAIDDSYGDVFASRGWAFLWRGNVERALQDFERNIELNGRSVSALSNLAIAHYRAGDEETTVRLLDEILAMDPATYASYENVARVFVTLGDFESAFEWLERGYAARSRGMIFLNEQRSWDSVRDDERFQDLMRRLNMGVAG